MLARTDVDTFSDTSHDLTINVCAVVDGRPPNQLTITKGSNANNYLGCKACDPITIPEDDEQDAVEITYINLDSDDEASAKEHHKQPLKQELAEAQNSCFQPVAKRQSPCNDIQEPKPAAQAKCVTQPLFRSLTKDDLHAANVELEPETYGVGLDACYGINNCHRTGNTASTVQGKKVSRIPSITLFNQERNKHGARKNVDAPRFAMSVANSKRKYTMNELGYNELVSPAQIESPLEKSARIAKRRRQRQDVYDPWSRKTDIGDVQSPIDFDYRMAGDGDGPAAVNEPLNKRETVARPDEKRSGPSAIRESSSVGNYQSTEDKREHPTTQCREDDGYGHMNASEISSTQTRIQDRDAQRHGVVINAADSNGSAIRKPGRKPRVGGPTSVCGVYSPEKKPPVKRSNHGAFHCPRCDSQYTTSKGVNYHFEKCVALFGNPKSLKWNDHPSLVAEGKRINPTNKKKETDTVRARAPVVHQYPASHERDVASASRPAPITDIASPSPASSIRVPGLSNLTEQRPISEEQAQSCSDGQPKFNHQTSVVENRATGGKGLSAETLKSFQETGHWDDGITSNQSAAEAQDDETEVPDVAYQYFVQKREWLETEDDAMESSLGSYRTMDEANAVARAEVQFPQFDEFNGVQSKGWSYCYRQDEHGMQTHMATVLGINIEAVVHRGKWEFRGLFLAKEADLKRLQS